MLGYRLYYGTESGLYQNSIDLGLTTRYSLSQVPLPGGKTYYFAVTAYNAAGESGFSNEVTAVSP